jgi:hypothetical protein
MTVHNLRKSSGNVHRPKVITGSGVQLLLNYCEEILFVKS